MSRCFTVVVDIVLHVAIYCSARVSACRFLMGSLFEDRSALCPWKNGGLCGEMRVDYL